MTNDTPSAKRTNAPQSWERQTVDEIIAAERRISKIVAKIELLEEFLRIAQRTGDATRYIEIQIDELEAELTDLQKEVERE